MSLKINFLPAVIFILIVFMYHGIPAHGQTVLKHGPPVPANFCINADEMELYLMINEYRKQYGLPSVPLSKSLSHVADLHARDLLLHHPDQGACNFHSWSNRGFWTPFCYPKDENKKTSVWDKPREITPYPSKAYEIVYWENKRLVKDTIIMVWKTEAYFNNFLLNTGKWQGKTWNAIGIAVYENYACAWFGEVPDPEGEAFVCGTKPGKKPADTLKPTPKPAVKPSAKPKKATISKGNPVKSDSLSVKSPDTLQTKSPETPPVKQAVSVVANDSVVGIYYIIIKTNLPKAEADKLVTTLRTSEYPGAIVLEKDGKIRVSAFDSSDKAAVMAKLKEVKKSYKDAWLLKR